MTTKALESLVDNINFNDIWIKMLDHNYEVRCGMYINSMRKMFKQIPTTTMKPLSPKQKVQKLMT